MHESFFTEIPLIITQPREDISSNQHLDTGAARVLDAPPPEEAARLYQELRISYNRAFFEAQRSERGQYGGSGIHLDSNRIGRNRFW